ncbi:hypothetical protein [Chelativorans oligotrophicus]|jgi:hypothetical protein|nr:hypothetical protein [Chelativorans oligotrophicus]
MSLWQESQRTDVDGATEWRHTQLQRETAMTRHGLAEAKVWPPTAIS